MEIKMGVTLQTKQVLSQVQMESLNILSMTMPELQEFLQKEEIENPLVEYSQNQPAGEMPVLYRDSDHFYGGGRMPDSGEGELYQIDNGPMPVEELLNSQIPWKRLGDEEKEIVDFCIQSLEDSGYLLVSAGEIGKSLGVSAEKVERVLDGLKQLEPRGIFASGLEECLVLQAQDLEHSDELERIIREHLKDVAEGKISNISRAMKLSSLEVRKLIQEIKELNPRPLNGYGRERAQYVFPDMVLSYQDGQWTIEMNDRWTGNIQINDFYVRMMETAQDEELKNYFETKLKRARFIMNAMEQRRQTLFGVARSILNRQAGYFLGKEPLKPMTLEEIAEENGIHKSTVSRSIRDKYYLTPVGCLLVRNLFTKGISTGDGDEENVSRNTIKDRLKAFVDREDKKQPLSDEKLARLLKDEGMPVSRRTVAKYRMELGIGGAFQRRREE